MIDKKLGTKFGKLTCIEFSHKVNVKSYYKFLCDCGNSCIKHYAEVKRERPEYYPPNCGCTKKENEISRSDKIGQINNKVKLIEYIGKQGTNPYFKYQCECGNIKKTAYQNFLRLESCGCKNTLKIGEIYGNYEIKSIQNTKCSVICKICNSEKILNNQSVIRKSSNLCTCNTGYRIKNYEFKKELKYYRRYINAAKSRRFKEFHIEFLDFVKLVNNNCHYCNIESKLTINGLNGLDRIDSNLGYYIDNVVSCCYTCNIMKTDLTQEEFFNHIKRIIKNREKNDSN